MPLAALTATQDQDNLFPAIMRFGITPMFLFGGAFYPIEQLPGWLQPVALVTPMYHGVEMARAIVLGTEPAVAPWVSILYLLALTAVGMVIAMAPMRRRLTP